MNKIAVLHSDAVLEGHLRNIIHDSGRYRCTPSYRTVETPRSRILADQPKIVVFDPGMQLPDGSGIDCIRWLKPRMENTEFLVFSSTCDAETVFKAIDAGATGYLCFGVSPEQIIGALDDLVAGGSPLSASIARVLLHAFAGGRIASAPLPGSLTRRESEVLSEIVRGNMLKEVTTTLGISKGTLNTHLRNLYRKLSVNSRSEIMARYFSGRPGSESNGPAPRPSIGNNRSFAVHSVA